ncbi:MAG: HAMP domain-containing protein, partial [Geminicoccaceae bacterium]
MAGSQRDGDRTPRKRRFGIRARTLGGLAVLLAVLLAIATALVADSWITLRDAARAEVRNALAGELARSALDLAFERGLTNAALTILLPPREALVDRIRGRRAASGAMLETAFERLAEHPDLLSAATRSDLQGAIDRVAELRRTIDAELARPLGDRDPQTSAAWLPAISGLLEVIRQAIGEQGVPAITLDARLQTVVEARLAAFDLRNAAGERAALIAGVLGSQKALSLPDAILMGSRSEATELHWRRLQRLSGAIRDPRLADGLDAVERDYFDTYAALLNRITAAGLAGQAYPVDLRTFGQATDAPLRSLSELVFLTQAIASEMLHRGAGRVELRLYASLAAVLAGLAVAGFSVLAFNNKVLRPIEQITEAMRRLAAGTAASEALPLAQRDEIGEMSQAIATFRDSVIASEAALSDAERFTHQTIDALPTQIAVLDESGIVVATNKSWRDSQRTDDARGSHEGQNYRAVCDRSVRDGDDVTREIAAGIRSVIAGSRDEFEIDYPCLTPSRRRWFRVRVARFAVPGPMRIVVTHDDITDRKQAEEGLQEKNRLLELSEQMSRTGHWRMDLDSGVLRWSSEIYRIHGWPLEDQSPDPKAALGAYHPEDREVFVKTAQGSIRSGVGFSLDLRLFRSDGQLRNVEVLAECEKAADGRAVA